MRRFGLFALALLVAIPAYAATVYQVAPYRDMTTRATWPSGSAPVGTECEAAPVAQSSTGKVQYHWLKGKLPPAGVAAPCVAVTIADPVPAPAPSPTPAPVPISASCPAQTPETVLAAKKVTVCWTNPVTGSAMTYDVAGSRIRFVTPAGCGSGCDGSIARPYNPRQVFVDSQPGDVYVLRAGTYNQNYGGNWGERNFALGPAQSGIALVAMPGETATLVRPSAGGGNVMLADGDSVALNPPNAAHNVTIAGFALRGGSEAVNTGGYWEREESGARGAIVVGNDITADYTGNTMTGVVTIQGDGAKVLGNTFHDFGTSPPINNNHALYVQTGADNVEVAYNTFRNLKLGHVIQFHNDGTKRQVDGAWVHHNLLKGAAATDMRGINFGDIGALSAGLRVEDNVLDTLGQNFSALAVYCGAVEFRRNRLVNVAGGGSGKIWTGTAGTPCSPAPSIRESGNTITGGTGPDWSGNIVHE